MLKAPWLPAIVTQSYSTIPPLPWHSLLLFLWKSLLSVPQNNTHLCSSPSSDKVPQHSLSHLSPHMDVPLPDTAVLA